MRNLIGVNGRILWQFCISLRETMKNLCFCLERRLSMIAWIIRCGINWAQLWHIWERLKRRLRVIIGLWRLSRIVSGFGLIWRLLIVGWVITRRLLEIIWMLYRLTLMRNIFGVICKLRLCAGVRDFLFIGRTIWFGFENSFVGPEGVCEWFLYFKFKRFAVARNWMYLICLFM